MTDELEELVNFTDQLVQVGIKKGLLPKEPNEDQITFYLIKFIDRFQGYNN